MTLLYGFSGVNLLPGGTVDPERIE
jgi:hypothetical protein